MRTGTHTHTRTRLATIIAILCTQATLQADTIIYQDGQVKGTLWANGSIGVDPEFRTPDNQATIKFTTTEAYGNGGINFYGISGPLTVPKNQATLRATIYSVNASMNGFVVRTSDGEQNFDSKRGRWWIDGEPGQTSDLSQGQWHTLDFDLSSYPSFNPGLTQIVGDGLTLKVNEPGATAYFGEIRLTEDDAGHYEDIPEPSTYSAILGLTSLLIASRRKSRK